GARTGHVPREESAPIGSLAVAPHPRRTDRAVRCGRAVRHKVVNRPERGGARARRRPRRVSPRRLVESRPPRRTCALVRAAHGRRCGPVAGATIVVNDLGDASDALPGDGVCATASGTCTLRAAITESNTSIDEVIGFDVSGTITVASQLTITAPVVIDGAAAGGKVVVSG